MAPDMIGHSDKIKIMSTLYLRMFTRIFLVFTSHVIKTKNRNHSINKVKNLGYDTTVDDCYINNLVTNQLSAVFHFRVICRSVPPKFIELGLQFFV